MSFNYPDNPDLRPVARSNEALADRAGGAGNPPPVPAYAPPAPPAYLPSPPACSSPPVYRIPAPGVFLPAPAPARADAPRAYSLRQALSLVLVTALCVSLFSSLGAYAVFSSFNPGGKTITPIIGSALGGSVPATTTGGANPAQIVSLTSDQAIVRAVAAVKPSVVTITTTGDTTGRFNSLVPYTGSGSGFIAGANGLILTNNHVIDGASSISVTLDSGKTYAASVLTADATHDLALLKIAAEGLPVLSLGDSSTVQLSEEIIAMGNPLGTFADSVSQGIVAGLDRSISVGDSGAGLTENLSGLIQTDAAINPGNSGGPMFDVNGEVVGIITASSSDASSLGFAVPINTAKAMISTAG